jgi:hypothetical protein
LNPLQDRELRLPSQENKLEDENSMAKAEGEEQMSVNYTLAVEPPRGWIVQVVDE